MHNGGTGALGARLKAGIPTIVIPFALDQHGWGRSVANLGLGPQPIPAEKVNAENLAAAIQTAVADQEMREKAKRLRKRIQAEDGLQRSQNF